MEESTISLYCVSAKGQEFISSVYVEPISQSFLNSDFNLIREISAMTIHDYTKDANIVQENRIDFKLVPENPSYLTCITKFSNYLHERKKAGVVSLKAQTNTTTKQPNMRTNRLTVYVLPPETRNQEYLNCSIKNQNLDSTSNGNAIKISQQIPHESINLPSTSNQPSVETQIFSAFCVTNQHSAPHSSSGTLSSGGTKRVELRNRIQKLELKLQGDLSVFYEDPHYKCLKLPPMSDEERYAVHDIVYAEHPTLIATTCGDDDEGQYVLVYRKDYQPPEIPVTAASSIVTGDHSYRKTQPLKVPHTGKRRKGETDNHEIRPDKLTFIPTDSVKRDRRTQEEILQDIKKKKEAKE